LVKLADLVERIESGVSVRSFDEPATADEKGVLKVSAVSDGRFNPAENKRIRDDELARAATHPVAGCSLVSRANTQALVGEVGFVEESRTDVYLPDKLWQLYPKRGLVDPFWFSLLLNSPHVRESARMNATGTSASMKNISQEAYLRTHVLLPPLKEQQRVAFSLRASERASRSTEKVLKAKRAFKRALLHELLTGRRFPEFTGTEVPRVPLGEVAIAGAVRNRGLLDEKHVMGVLKDFGMVPMRDHVRAQDLSRYQIVPPDGFAYNPMRLNIGSIARNLSGANCLVSPDYVVFTTDTSALLPQYLDQVRRSQIWSDFVRPAGSGSVRVRIYFRDLAELAIPLPSLPEQRRIADTLVAADREIALLEHLQDTYESQKRALMHRLLSGDLALPENVPALESINA
jgi:type I restriction enzyme S subunit